MSRAGSSWPGPGSPGRHDTCAVASNTFPQTGDREPRHRELQKTVGQFHFALIFGWSLHLRWFLVKLFFYLCRLNMKLSCCLHVSPCLASCLPVSACLGEAAGQQLAGIARPKLTARHLELGCQLWSYVSPGPASRSPGHGSHCPACTSTSCIALKLKTGSESFILPLVHWPVIIHI